MISRKDFLKAIPLAPLAAVAVSEGIHRVDLEPAGHYIFFVDVTRVDIQALLDCGNEQVPLMPKGSKGGWIIGVHGDVENAVKIFRLNDKAAEVIVKESHEITNG